MLGSSDSGQWIELGGVAPDALRESGLALHWAAQIPAALGSVLIAARDDDSHSNLGWIGDERGALQTHPLDLEPPLQVAIRPLGLRLEIVSATERRVSDRSLIGRTLEEGLESAVRDLESVGGQKLPEIPFRDYDMPAHPVQQGAPFGELAEVEVLEIGRWFCNFAGLFADLEKGARERSAVRSADPARVWPHHFDLGMVLQLEPGSVRFAGSELESVGIGLAAGDEHLAEPYLYVNPWPAPEATTSLPDLGPVGRWQREGFVGAVSPGSEIVAVGDAQAQSAGTRGFLDRALDLLLGD